MGEKLKKSRVIISDLDIQDDAPVNSKKIEKRSNEKEINPRVIRFDKIEDNNLAKKNNLSDLEDIINDDEFTLCLKGKRTILQKEDEKGVLVNEDNADIRVRIDGSTEIYDSYHGESNEPLPSISSDNKELQDIIKKLCSLSNVKQVIVEKKKSQETTKLKMKIGNSHNDEIEDIDVIALNKEGHPIGIGIKQDEEPELIVSDDEVHEQEQPVKEVKKYGDVKIVDGLKKISEKYERKTSHEKAVYKKSPKGTKNEYFYKVKSHQELYQVGMSYYRDMASGNKSMAFITHDSYKELKDSILAIASFIKYQENIKILIVSLGLENYSYQNVVAECKENGTIIGENDDSVPTIYDHAGLNFLDYKDIFSFRAKYDETGYGELIDYLVGSYDLILWDVPKLEDLKVSKEEYFPIFIAFDKVSIVIKKQVDKYQHVNEMKKFFNKYGIKIKGVLFSHT